MLNQTRLLATSEDVKWAEGQVSWNSYVWSGPKVYIWIFKVTENTRKEIQIRKRRGIGLSAEILLILRDQSVEVEPAKETEVDCPVREKPQKKMVKASEEKVKKEEVFVYMSNVANELGKLRTDS